MSIYYDGVNKRKNNTEVEVVYIENSFSGFDENDTKTQEFRGFEKVPRVVLTRYNIEPYLKRDRIVQGCHIIGLSNQHSTRILQKCTVKLIRENLGQLKQSLKFGSPRSDVSASDLNETMASLSCKICEKVYASEKKLHNHQERKHLIVYHPKPQKRVSFSEHIIVHEVKEYHKCRKCPKIFENYKSLRVHMKQLHKKRKCYICHYCSKDFVYRMFFKVHIKLHCDVCGLLLPNKSKYLEHRRVVCGVRKKHICKTCNCTFFFFMDLKDHSYDHLGTFFICDICKDQFETKCEVSHHISFLHSNHQFKELYTMRHLGNDRLYLCNFCEETSVDRDLIEKHVQSLPDLTNRTMTGYKDYYFCDQCLRKFDTEQEMLQHKWTHFLRTSDNSQKRIEKVNVLESPKKKTSFNVNEPLPEYMKPQLVLQKLELPSQSSVQNGLLKGILETNDNIKEFDNEIAPKKKKTLFSEHQCQSCGKYFSSNYCLHRHIVQIHNDYEHLRCHMCEEVFVWPSLLKSHKCIRLHLPEMPFDDARPEIHFDNLHSIHQNELDDYMNDEDDYINAVDFEIPAPIVELTEGTNVFMMDTNSFCEVQNNITDTNCISNMAYEPNALNPVSGDKNGMSNALVHTQGYAPLNKLGYKVVLQEVPVEF